MSGGIRHKAKSIGRLINDFMQGVYHQRFLCIPEQSFKGKYDQTAGLLICKVDDVPITRYFQMKSLSSYDPISGKLSGVASEIFLGGGGGKDKDDGSNGDDAASDGDGGAVGGEGISPDPTDLW